MQDVTRSWRYEMNICPQFLVIAKLKFEKSLWKFIKFFILDDSHFIWRPQALISMRLFITIWLETNGRTQLTHLALGMELGIVYTVLCTKVSYIFIWNP
jgi:hypothetical protein